MEPTRKSQAGMAAIAFGLIAALMPQTERISILNAQEPPTVEAQTQDALLENQALLLKARQSLMRRDVASAERFLRQAESLDCVYEPSNDRPEYVQALVEEFSDVERQASVNGMTESVRRDLARSYLNQAEALRRCQDFDNAEALVMEVRGMGITPDADLIQNGMDADSIAQRISDDRMTVASIARASAPQEPALTGLSDAARRQVVRVEEEVARGRALAAAGNLEEAEKIARNLIAAGIPENAFTNDSPSRLLSDIAAAKASNNGGVVPSVFEANVGNAPEQEIRQVQGFELTPNENKSHGYIYAEEADAALRAGNTDAALNNYRDALRYEKELDGETVKRIVDAIDQLSAPAIAETTPVSETGIDLTMPPQNIQTEISTYIAKTYQIRNNDPQEALKMLNQLKTEIRQSKLDDALKNNFLYAVDMALADTNRFNDTHGPMIALDNKNKAVDEEVRQGREERLQIENRLVEDIERFNQLIEDGRYDEAEILAKKCRDYSHESTVSIQMVRNAQIKKQVAFNNNLKESRENGWLGAMNDVESASVINVNDANPLALGPQWDRVKARTAIENGERSESDLEILNKLETRINLPFEQPMPLNDVLDYIRETLQINLLTDQDALAKAGIGSDTPVETNLKDIKLKNYLKHILTPYDLNYVVENEALTITDKSKVGGNIVTKVYYVLDLVTPIPNFVEVNNPRDMQSSFDRAYEKATRRGNGQRSVMDSIPNMATGMNSMVGSDVLAQIQASGTSAPFSSGAAGGGNNPDELISLITNVVDPESWDIVGEPEYFSLNNSLIIRQNEENHQEIRNLLEQLRSLMDMQIAIEVRYVSISDEYFEQIGVNFGATFKTNAPAKDDGNGYSPNGKGIYGITSAATGTGKPFTESLNIDFSQNSYGMAVPQFGNYDPSVGAQLGFAILSDIDTYFFISASEADRRTNVMQAPKVMMFNGQTAQISDQTQIPYVYTVIPVVGDFAVAQQPVTTVINEGQFMTVQATVLKDRQHVRMTMAPFFSTVTDSDRQFTFDGSETTVSSSTSSRKGSEKADNVTDERNNSSSSEVISTGTTIQQPVVSSFSVSTTVQCPDGGTVILGGIKRLNEGRSEAGVPILSKIPYIKRLFSNTSIGRETTSLMMMVTPRIVIQDEEEKYLTGLTEKDFNTGGGDEAFKLK